MESICDVTIRQLSLQDKERLYTRIVQKLAGHSDIRTTQRYYLSIQAEDIQKAQDVQAEVLGKILENDLTDPKLTHSAQKRAFPGRKTFQEES